MRTFTSSQESSSPLTYRPDIDGLRAVAILAVVLYHAFPSKVHGGFVGVDIFFVISGYLISSIIFRGLENGKFSFLNFYAHRVRRIFPALILVLLTSFGIGWFVLLPDEFKQLGKHMAAGAGFVQNIVLWKEAGYFDNASELKPLMHLWSLAVEEQFYLFYPLLIWGVWRLGLNALTIILVLALLSFGQNVHGVHHDIVKTFFLPQTRFWELLAGSILAYIQLFKRDNFMAKVRHAVFHPAVFSKPPVAEKRQHALNNILSTVGFLLVLAAIFGINKSKLFPGWWALAPVISAFLMILAGPESWVNRKILASKVMLFFGLISYPLYLWHWIFLSFAQVAEGDVPAVGIRCAALFISFILAWFTYKFIEYPIRFGAQVWWNGVLLFASMILMACTGYYVYRNDGLGFWFEKLTLGHANEVQKIAAAWNFRGYPVPDTMHSHEKYKYQALGPDDSRKKILFVGDSHTQQYWNTVSKILAKKSLSDFGVMFTDLNFPPEVPEDIVKDASIKKVVFSYYWAYKYGSAKVNQPMRCCGAGKGGTVGSYTLPLKSYDEMGEVDLNIKGIVTTLKKAGKDVYFILDNPFGEELDPHSQLTRSLLGGIHVKMPPVLRKSVALQRMEPVRSKLIKIASEAGVHVIDPVQYLCEGDICPAFSKDGEVLYKDYDHISLNASKNQVRYLDSIFVK